MTLKSTAILNAVKDLTQDFDAAVFHCVRYRLDRFAGALAASRNSAGPRFRNGLSSSLSAHELYRFFYDFSVPGIHCLIVGFTIDA